MTNDPLPPLRDVIRSHDLAARRSLGQNFLLDLNLTRRIARSAGELSQGSVIEIGPGPGGLTRALLMEGATHLIVIEKDERAVAIQREIAAAWPRKMEIIQADATTIDISGLGTSPRRIVANLPYNISTGLLLQWLRKIDAFESLTLLFQEEVVNRLAASPGSSEYGRLSVVAQWLCEIRPQFNISREAFTPSPKVNSTLVRLIPRKQPLAKARMETLEKVTQAAFGQRRKMLRSSLKQLGNVKALLEATDIAPDIRAEQLSVADFCALANAVDELDQAEKKSPLSPFFKGGGFTPTNPPPFEKGG